MKPLGTDIIVINGTIVRLVRVETHNRKRTVATRRTADRKWAASLSYRVGHLEASEHALDGVAVPVEYGREAEFPTPVDLRRDVGGNAFRFDLAANGIAVVAAVAVRDVGLGLSAAERSAMLPPVR